MAGVGKCSVGSCLGEKNQGEDDEGFCQQLPPEGRDDEVLSVAASSREGMIKLGSGSSREAGDGSVNSWPFEARSLGNGL